MKISTVKKDFMRNATSKNAQKAARAAGDCGGTCIKDPSFCRSYQGYQTIGSVEEYLSKSPLERHCN